MSRKLKKSSKMYAYLNALGVLDKSDEEIKTAKRDYYRMYKRTWKQNKLKTSKSYLVVLSLKEYAVVKVKATKHKRSITRYLKEAALAYARNTFLVPDIGVVYEIKDMLNRMVIHLQTLLSSANVSHYDAASAIHQVEAVEAQVLTLLLQPPSVGDWLRKALKEDITIRQQVLDILKSVAIDH